MSPGNIWSSMTGYGTATVEAPDVCVAVEARSVNQKNREVRLHSTPRNLAWEHDVQQVFVKGIARGKLDVRIYLETQSGTGGLSEAALQRLRGRFYRLSLYLGARASGIIEELAGDTDATPEVDQRFVIDAATQALAALCQSRRDEGAGLAAIVAEQRDALRAGLNDLAQTRGGEQAALRRRLEDKLAVLRDAGLPESDRNRLEEEVTYQLIRGDVSEELDRLDLHLQALDTLLETASPVGKRLDVLAQEIGREVHTLCAKLADPVAKEIAMNLRPLVDQLREQVQNIE